MQSCCLTRYHVFFGHVDGPRIFRTNIFRYKIRADTNEAWRFVGNQKRTAHCVYGSYTRGCQANVCLRLNITNNYIITLTSIYHPSGNSYSKCAFDVHIICDSYITIYIYVYVLASKYIIIQGVTGRPDGRILTFLLIDIFNFFVHDL